jgi:iron complex outermembrane receptor protein
VFTPVRSFDIDCSGRPALYAPDWTISFGVQQTVPLRTWEIVANLDTRYRSDRVVGFNYLPGGNTGDDFTVDASLSFESQTNGLTVTAFGRNLTEEVMPATYQVGAGNVAASAFEPPRTYGVRVGYKF